jgi:hypothetical protein
MIIDVHPEKSKPPALRVVGDSEHYYERRYKSPAAGAMNDRSANIYAIWQNII